LKKKQMTRGITAGCNETVKMIEDPFLPLLTCPALTHMPKWPSTL
jgi:hypothetical protein